MNPSEILNSSQKKDRLVRSLTRYNLAIPFSERRILLIVGDVLILYAAGLITLWGRSLLQTGFTVQKLVDQGQIFWLLPLALVWIAVAAINECYDLKVADQPRAIVQGLIVTTLVVGTIYLLLFFILGRPVAPTGPNLLANRSVLIDPLYSLPRIIPVSFLLLALLLIIIWRIGYIRLSVIFPLRRRAIVVGAGRSGTALIHATQALLPGYEFVGFVDDDPDKQGQQIAGIPVLGNRSSLAQEVKRRRINEVILAITHDVHDDLFRALMNCYEHGVVIRPMSLFYEDTLGRIPVEHLGQQSLLVPFWSDVSLPTFYRVSKRLLDILIALLGLTLLVIILPITALAIYLNSPGPIFYAQERAGKAGRGFRVFKFRSMVPDAEVDGQAVWASKDDRRITRVGKFLRRTRLDELPQLYNVLRGEMSIVGPRPERPEFIASLQTQIPFYRARLSVKPGLTGWAQIQYHYVNSLEGALIKLEYDLYYVKYRSMVLDLLIIFRTIRVILLFKGT
jgi:exopolysaccharide biosynthesis polyprenyl glycosylphosphotransferase